MREQRRLDSQVKFPTFKWTTTYSKEYYNVIEDINNAYKKMVIIGEAKKVFRDEVCPMMTAETKADFQKAKKK